MSEQPQRELHESEIDKNAAEAEKLRAEAAAATLTAEANAEKARSEARKADAEAAVAEVELAADKARLVSIQHDSDRAEEKRRKELTADEHHHVYHFNGGVSGSSVEKCLSQLDHWDRTEEPGEITIVFFSPGGEVMSGMHLFDHILAMRSRGWHFTAVTRGYAASMAGILLQAADVRVCGPESYILIHEISSGAVGKIGELEDEVEFVKVIQKRVNDIFVKRAEGKVTGAKLRAMYRRKDFWLSSDAALKLGIVDEIR